MRKITILPLAAVLLSVACQGDRPLAPEQADLDPLAGPPGQPTVPSIRPDVEPASTEIMLVDPASLTCTDVVDFEDVTGSGGSGTNYDGILASGGVPFAERFGGQTLSFAGNFDVLGASASGPLALQVGAPNENLDVLVSGTNVLTGLGPTGFPNFSAVGEGSWAGLFPSAQFELGFDIVGVDGGGNFTINFFKSDGSNIETVIVPLNSAGSFAFRRTGSVSDIAGVSIHNTDPAGIGYDNITWCANQPPDCSGAAANPDALWPPNHQFAAIDVVGVTDPDGDPVTINIDAIWQDEPTDTFGDGKFTPDGQGVGTSIAEVRAERAGTKKVPGNGRVYHILFTADDGQGGSCSSEVLVGVPHDQNGDPAVDDGALFDSTI